MRQSLSKQTKWMTSKELYFLPIIKQFKINHQKPHNTEHKSANNHKSIEHILQNKQNKLQRNDPHQASQKQLKSRGNLYNKYEGLPKIYMSRNRKPSNIEQQSQKTVLCKDKCLDNEQAQPLNKQNSFNLMYYKDHFNKRLLEQSEKIELRLNYNFSSKGLFLKDYPDNTQRHPVKYIRIKTIQQEPQSNQSLRKIPQFLMKLLQPQKHVTT